jgi:hypothetical protein
MPANRDGEIEQGTERPVPFDKLISTETEVDGMETGASAGSTETGRNPCAPSLPASLAQSCRRQQKTCEGWSS